MDDDIGSGLFPLFICFDLNSTNVGSSVKFIPQYSEKATKFCEILT